jgi:hypothetical protein
VQAKAIQNVFVDSVWLNTPFIREMQVNTLTVKLSNTGERAVQNLPIKLFVDEVQIASAVANIDAHGAATANFNFTVKDKGFKKGRISFDDTPVTLIMIITLCCMLLLKFVSFTYLGKVLQKNLSNTFLKTIACLSYVVFRQVM